MKKPPVIIRRGDVWHCFRNHGTIVRHVRSVSYCGVVSYLNNGRFYQCSIAAFRRWTKGAFLAAADDWSGREEVKK